MTEPLRVAVPNKGSLADPASAILGEAGYRQRTDSRELVLADPDNGVE
ncbi:MAG: ATP phosphoribosyltransferase, partial [Actinomycetota bacterium]|nr:ATP phosphoribosyltransferase [Actinomycetota bacterium]